MGKTGFVEPGEIVETINMTTFESGILAPNNVLVPVSTSSSEPALTQMETSYVEKSPDTAQHCSICSHFLGAGACELVKPEPKPIMDQGRCDRFADVSVEEMNKIKIVAKEQSVETKGFIYLPIRWVWEIERIQSALYTLFGYDLDWNFYSSYTYHITLAYCDSVTDEQMLEAAKAVIGMTAVPIKFVGWGTFPADDDKQTLYLKVEENSDLRALQRALYDSLVAQGVAVSEVHAPDAFVPHMSIALVPAGAVVPEAAIDISAYCNEVVLGRDNYTEVAKISLKWNESVDINPDEGMSPALEQARWEVSGVPDLTVETHPTSNWSAARAVKTALEIADYGRGDRPGETLGVTRPMFLVYDAAAPSLLTSYRYPFAEMIDSKLIVTAESLRAATLSLAQDKDLPPKVVEQALEVINSYKKLAGIGEMTKIRLTMVSEMRGDYPDIQLPDGIDLTAIEEITGEKPVFVTLPIGQAEARSNNQRTYSTEAVNDLVEQVNANRPYGGWGHMTEEQMATDFDPPAVQWLAAVMEEATGIAWGRLLALTQETRDYYRMAKATSSKVATSLIALAEMQRDRVLALDLKRIDIADPARIGLPITVAAPLITTEMATAGDVFVKTRTKPRHEAQQPEVLAQEQIAQAAGATSVVKAGTDVPVVTQEQSDKKGKFMLTETQIQELQSNEATLKTQATELTSANTQLAADAAKAKEREDALIAELNVLLGEFLVAEIEREVLVPSFHGMVKKQVLRGKPQSRDAIKAAVKEFLDDPDNQEAMKNQVAVEMGKPQITNHKPLTTEQANPAKPGTMQHFEFDPVDPAPRPLQKQEA